MDKIATRTHADRVILLNGSSDYSYIIIKSVSLKGFMNRYLEIL